MSWIYKKKLLEESGCCNVNFLFNDDKVYIMDNHLCAIWCWEQKINPELKYGLFHIDRHYDLLYNLSDDFLVQNRGRISGNNFNEFLLCVDIDTARKLRYDNYIDAFCRLHPNLITYVYYVTHEDGNNEINTSLEHIEKHKPSLWDLPTNISYWINDCREVDRWILNLDIDFFFQDIGFGNAECQFLTNKYISRVCQEIKVSYPKIDVITIALSPEFCGGWGNAFHVIKQINRELEIPMQFKYKQIKGIPTLI